MTTTPDIDWLDREFLEAAARIERHGYTNFCIDYGACSHPGCDSGPGRYPWTYTAGFHRIGHPELVMMALPMRHVNCVSAAVFSAAFKGDPMEVGPHVRHHIHDDLTIALMPVPDKWLQRDSSRMAAWFGHFGEAESPSVLQAVWADSDGLMPWEHTIRPACFDQEPVLLEDPIRFPTPPRNIRQAGRMPKRRKR